MLGVTEAKRAGLAGSSFNEIVDLLREACLIKLGQDLSVLTCG